MSLLSAERNQAVKSERDRPYNAGWTYGPAGGITASEFTDIKEGDRDRATGRKRCAFCRQPKALKTGNGTTCDRYCERHEYAGVPVGKPYPGESVRRGREWLTLG